MSAVKGALQCLSTMSQIEPLGGLGPIDRVICAYTMNTRTRWHEARCSKENIETGKLMSEFPVVTWRKLVANT